MTGTNDTIDVNWQFARAFPEPRLQPHLHLLAERLQEGHICIEATPARQEEGTSPTGNFITEKELSELQPWVGNFNTIAPFILHRHKLYLHRYFHYETAILHHIRRLLAAEKNKRDVYLQQLQEQKNWMNALSATYAVAGLPPHLSADWQLAAALMAALQHLTIITGGPGTGKTTTVAKIIWLLLSIQPSLRIALAAPTGKAATRMAESLMNTTQQFPDLIRKRVEQLRPATLHQLLGHKKDSIYFRHNEAHPLPYDLVIVDECSMIDAAIFAKLFAAIGPNTRLLLLGDKNQLASVEAGSLFGDLCNQSDVINAFSPSTFELINGFLPSAERKIPAATPTNHPLAEHIIELQYSHRFNSNSGIGRFSYAVLHNDTTVIDSFLQDKNSTEIQVVSPPSESVLTSFLEGYRNYILAPDISEALHLLQQQRILCAVKLGKGGLYESNQTAENWLKKQQLLQPDNGFYENRPIIITRNNKELNLVNGDIGIVRTINGEKKVWFDAGNGQVRGVSVHYIQNAETVFAMTIHKSQGSEYDQVLIRLPEQAKIALLTRELLYTAVTRAKKQAIIVSSPEVLKTTAAGRVARVSGISTRMDEI
ncbi:MAG: exodeoxyribonuclease V subunit alpha [Bacteroidota bacterium]